MYILYSRHQNYFLPSFTSAPPIGIINKHGRSIEIAEIEFLTRNVRIVDGMNPELFWMELEFGKF